jgi:hypothetical protein
MRYHFGQRSLPKVDRRRPLSPPGRIFELVVADDELEVSVMINHVSWTMTGPTLLIARSHGGIVAA